jgi:multiple sugar transport system ATP-binding protein
MTVGNLTVEGLVKTYGSTRALDDVTSDIPGGSLTVIVGPSGCGKSTLLNIIAGLLPVDHGRILLDEQDVTTKPLGERDLGMVFQDYALYPHMTIAKNISFGLDLKRRHGDRSLTPAIIRSRVVEAAQMVRIEELLDRKPSQLSGGQKQRVALARSVVRHPRLLLLDEPLSALDAQLRATAREELLRLHSALRSTIVMVTHDQHEALSMATHLIVMNGGRIIQAGPPSELYAHPVDEFVARFVGSPAMNIHAIDGRRIGWRPGSGAVRVAEDARDLPAGQAIEIDGTVDVREYSGDSWLLSVILDDADTRVRVDYPRPDNVPLPGQRVRITIPQGALHEFDHEGRTVARKVAA